MNSSMIPSEALYGWPNPFHFGAAAYVDPTSGSAPAFNSPELLLVADGVTGYILLCNSTVYDVSYNTVNGSITRFDTTPSNGTVTDIFQGAQAQSELGSYYLLQIANLAPFSSSAQEMADKLAYAFSQTFLAIVTSALNLDQAVEVQQRTTSLVTRIEKAPLFTLVGANLLIVLLGIVFGVIALVNSAGEVREVQARLSIVGLIADHFEGKKAKEGTKNLEDLFEERDGQASGRVVIQTSDRGGYEYQSL
ncbi:MAG: hypothetical protein M1821_007139 [Bathelium mastoideum]|nr:MAG: hypothetical protein M1821_007139 [Bathelium mastoideum]KAI9694649.1 MAG: hypothetical protein M1822_000265 [Bathelium mastoideum]